MNAHVAWPARILGAAALVVAALLTVGPADLSARDPDCTTSGGQPRECTASEEMLSCLQNGVDAYDQCRTSGGFFNWVACTLGWEIDFYSCVAIAPIATLMTE